MFTPILVFGQDQVYFSETWTQDGGESALFYKNSSTTDDAGNVYMAGSAININNNHDIIIQKFDPDGGLLWEEIFNGAANMDDFAADVFVDDNYDVFITGSSVKLAANDQDLVVLKYNSSGVFQWYSYYDNGGGPTPKDFGTSITGDNNGSVYVTGGSFGATSNSDFITLGIASNNGAQLWEKRYDYAALQDVAAKIKYDGNNLFVSGGSQINFNRWELATLTYNPLNGDQLYERRSQGNATQGVDEVYDLTVDDLGNVYIAGAVRNLNSGYDMSVYKLDPQLNIIWENHHDGYGADDRGKGVKVDDLGNVYVAGFVTNPNEGKNYSLLKYNATGVLQWAREFNGQANLDDEAVQLVIASNQDIFVTGTARNNADSDFQTLGYKPNGELFTQAIFEGVNGFDDVSTGIAIDLAENIIVVGKMGEANGNYKDVTVKYSLIERSGIAITPSNGIGKYLNNNVIVKFDKSQLNILNIDRKAFTAGRLDEFVDINLIGQMSKLTGFNWNRLTTYKIHRNATSADSLSYTRLGDTIRLPEFWTSLIVEIPEGYDELYIADTLKSIFGIHNAQLEYIYHTNSVPNDDFYGNYQLGLYPNSIYPNADINVEGAWEILDNNATDIGSSDVKVGIHDHLIDYSHFEFGPTGTLQDSKIRGGKNYKLNTNNIVNANTLTISHGTQVAGIIGANRNNDAGIAGIAGGDFAADPLNRVGVQLYSLGIFYLNWNTPSSMVAEAMIEASLNTNTGYGFGLDISNHSYGKFETGDKTVRDALKISWKNNTINIAARGNNGADANHQNIIEFPACYYDPMVINVMASGNDGEIKDLSNGSGNWASSYGVNGSIPSPSCKVDIMAPGTNLLVSTTSNSLDASTQSTCNVPSSQNNSNYSCFDRTSASTAMVTGVAALMYSAHRPETHWRYKNKLTVEDIENIMQKTASNQNTYSINNGYGLLDAREAVNQITSPYTVMHRDFYDWAGNATNMGSLNNFTASFPEYGVPNSTYYNYATKFKLEWDVSYTPSNGNEIIDWWESESLQSGGAVSYNINANNLLGQEINGDYFWENYTVDISNNTVSGTVTTFYYFMSPGAPYADFWFPRHPSEIKYSYSLHLLNPTLSTLGQELNSKITIYPNPAESSITVSNIQDFGQKGTIQIFDAMGREMRLINFDNNTNSANQLNIDINSMSKGIYFLRLDDGSKHITKKFVKE
jgi:hypothetical protein